MLKKKLAKPRGGPGRLNAEDAAKVSDRLLDAALELFNERSFADTTMEQIARRAGASTKTLYARYSDKAAVVDAVVNRIIKQALDKLDKLSDKKSYTADVPEWVLPPKENVYNQMEALIWHFKIVMGETNVPMGEVYHCVEGANGELGFYLVSDGGRTPARLHFRRPCFIYYQAYPEMIKGTMLSDAILTMSSMNVIAGELDA